MAAVFGGDGSSCKTCFVQFHLQLLACVMMILFGFFTGHPMKSRKGLSFLEGINIIFKPLLSLEAVLLFHILISSHYSDSMVKILFVANIVEEDKEKKFDGIIPAAKC